MKAVAWTASATRDVDRIEAYIAQHSPAAARRLSIRLISAAKSLSENPERGRPYDTVRRVLVIIRPYVIYYRVTAAAVIILRVRHGARRSLTPL